MVKSLLLAMCLLFSANAYSQQIASVVPLPFVGIGADTHNTVYGKLGLGVLSVIPQVGIVLVKADYEIGLASNGVSVSVINLSSGMTSSRASYFSIFPLYGKASMYENGASAYSVGVYGPLSVGLGVQYSPVPWNESKRRKASVLAEAAINLF